DPLLEGRWATGPHHEPGEPSARHRGPRRHPRRGAHLSARRLVAAACLAAAAAATASATEPMRVRVDLTSIPRRVVHADLKSPAAPGPLTLYYPKFLPGDHGPTGPIDDLGGIFFRAGGKELAWTRGPEDMYVFKVVVPEGATEVDVAL